MTDEHQTSPSAVVTACAWKEAIIEALIVNCIFTKAHETDPTKALANLVGWEVKLALDPAVSKEAFELHERIKALEADVERERFARRVVDEALRQAVEETRALQRENQQLRAVVTQSTGIIFGEDLR